MQVTETLSEGLRRSYAVCVPASDIESRAKARLADLGKTLRLPGFRPGKVPPNLVRQRYGSSVMAEVLQEAVNGVADQVIAERQLRPAGRPRVSLDGEPPVTVGAPADLNIKVEMELLPEIVLPDLASIQLTRLRAEPSDEVVAATLENIVTQNRELEDIEEVRPAVAGDVLVVDFTGFHRRRGVPGRRRDGCTGRSRRRRIHSRLHGTARRTVTGRAAHDRGNVPGRLPGPGAGREGGFVRDFGQEAAAFCPARARRCAGAKSWGWRASRSCARPWSGRCRTSTTSCRACGSSAIFWMRWPRRLTSRHPRICWKRNFAAIWQRVDADRREGRVDEEDQGKDEDVLRAEYRAIADRRVKLGLLLSDIGRLNNIEVSQAELSQALRAEASRYPGQEMQVIKFFQENQGAIDQLRGPIFEDKVVDYILLQAQVAEQLVPPEALAPTDSEPAAPALANTAAASSGDAEAAHDEAEAVPAAAEAGPDAEGGRGRGGGRLTARLEHGAAPPICSRCHLSVTGFCQDHLIRRGFRRRHRHAQRKARSKYEGS